MRLELQMARSLPIPLTTGYTMDAQDVVHVPDLTLNLLSVHKMVKQGDRSVIFDVNGCRLLNRHVQVKPECILATGTQVNGMYYLNRCQTSSYVAEVEQSKVVNLASVTRSFKKFFYATVTEYGDRC